MYDVRFLQFSQVHERRVIFNALVADGVAKSCFYSLRSPTFKDFEGMAGPQSGWCVPVYKDGELVAVGWLNGFTGRAVFCHFCVLRDYMPEAVHMGKAWCRAVLDTGKFDCLIGLTPSTYRHALNFIQEIGFELSPMRVRGACFMARQGRYVDGIYSRLLEVQ